jgi:hypothetical protein
MAFQKKFTAKRGQIALNQIAVSAGTAEAQTDTISINIDATKLTKGDALILIDNIRHRIHASNWPAV